MCRPTDMGLLAQLVRHRRSAASLAWQALAVRSLHTTSALLEPAPKPVPLSKLKDSFLDGTSSTYLEELEERYRANPASVDKTWASFFNSMGKKTNRESSNPSPAAFMQKGHNQQN